MTFREAMRILGFRITQEDVAKATGMSYYSIRQAVLPQESSSYRSPPRGWQAAMARLARQRAAALLDLAEQLDADGR